MSDLQDLIHTNAHNAYMTGHATGRIEEHQRIVKLLEQAINDNGKDSWKDAIALIKGEQK